MIIESIGTQEIIAVLVLEQRLDELALLLNHDEVSGGVSEIIEGRMQELQEAIEQVREEAQLKNRTARTIPEIVEAIIKN